MRKLCPLFHAALRKIVTSHYFCHYSSDDSTRRYSSEQIITLGPVMSMFAVDNSTQSFAPLNYLLSSST